MLARNIASTLYITSALIVLRTMIVRVHPLMVKINTLPFCIKPTVETQSPELLDVMTHSPVLPDVMTHSPVLPDVMTLPSVT